MSSNRAEPGAQTPHASAGRACRWLRRLRDLFAVLGVLAVVLAIWLYQRGLSEAGDLTADTRRYLAQAGWRALRGNVAEALSTRIAVSEGKTPAALETALRARAGELELPLGVLYPGDDDSDDDTATPARNADVPLRIWSVCTAEQVARLVALEPRLSAFMPCRIVLYRDERERYWLATANLELLVTGGREPADALRRDAVGMHDRILDLMAAAAD